MSVAKILQCGIGRSPTFLKQFLLDGHLDSFPYKILGYRKNNGSSSAVFLDADYTQTQKRELINETHDLAINPQMIPPFFNYPSDIYYVNMPYFLQEYKEGNTIYLADTWHGEDTGKLFNKCFQNILPGVTNLFTAIDIIRDVYDEIFSLMVRDKLTINDTRFLREPYVIFRRPAYWININFS